MRVHPFYSDASSPEQVRKTALEMSLLGIHQNRTMGTHPVTAGERTREWATSCRFGGVNIIDTTLGSSSGDYG